MKLPFWCVGAVMSLSVGCVRTQAPVLTPTTNTTGTVNPPPSAIMPLFNTAWPIRTREHVDLWLHSYAMLMPDTTGVPYFSRGYAERMASLRQKRNVSSLLDQNRGKLLQRMAENPALATAGQFLPLYFSTWEGMRQVIDQFLRGGRPMDATQAMQFAVLNGAYPAAADRDWLRQFADAVDDESRRFYHDYWLGENRQRALLAMHTDSVWQRQWRPALQRYLNNTQQQNGELYLSLPLGGEGRTVLVAKGDNAIAVPSPTSNAEADVVLFVVAHEVTGAAANTAIADNTTPAEQRAGSTSRYEQSAAVRAGAMLLERTIPSVVTGYMRYYLLQAGRSSPNDPRAAFTAAFAIPDAIRDAISHQLDVTLGGI